MTENVIYLIGVEDEIKDALDFHGARVCSISVPDWNTRLSPWPAKAVFRGEKGFSGGAPEYLNRIESEVIPAYETGWNEITMNRYVVGYSLAGLFALYTLYQTSLFTGAAAVSGSFWYDGFVDYARETPFAGKPHRIYLSLGDQEAKTRNRRLATVEKSAEKLADIFKERGVKTCFELNPGNHFVDVKERLQKAIDWLLREAE